MPNRSAYNLEFRPHSYWGPATLEHHYGRRIHGELRRRAVIDELAAGQEVPSDALASQLDTPNRQALGAIHPQLMGGEYLPPFKHNEVEIARAVLESVTMDVVSIRARLARTRIHYRIVDEYCDENDSAYKVHPRISREPLSLGQTIRMIDRAAENGLDGHARHWNYEEIGEDPERLAHFCTISSEFYPELGDWFSQKNEEWLATEEEKIARRLAEQDGEEYH